LIWHLGLANNKGYLNFKMFFDFNQYTVKLCQSKQFFSNNINVHSISCRNSLFLFLNNLKTSFSQFRAKSKHSKPTQIQTHSNTTFCSSKSLSLPSHSLPNPWTGHSIRNSRAKRVWSDIVLFENKTFVSLKILRAFFN